MYMPAEAAGPGRGERLESDPAGIRNARGLVLPLHLDVHRRGRGHAPDQSAIRACRPDDRSAVVQLAILDGVVT